MTTITFDTLGYFEKLKAAGMPEAQAKVQAHRHAPMVFCRQSAVCRFPVL